jgi:hypothetical protein
MLNDRLAYLSRLAAGAVSVWLFFWPIRRKSEVDFKLDRAGQLVRWSIVIVGGVFLLAFLAWPNFAYHLVLQFRRSPAAGSESHVC